MKQILYKSFSKLALFAILIAGAGLISELEAQKDPEVWALKRAEAPAFEAGDCAERSGDGLAEKPCGPLDGAI